MKHCDRKQFKLAMDGSYVSADSGGSFIAGLVALTTAVILLVMAWMWLVKPAIERRWMSPRFLGHYLLYPEEGTHAAPRPLEEDPQPNGTTVANTDNSNLFTGSPWRNNANVRRTVKAENRSEPYVTDIRDTPAAMVPVTDGMGAPVSLDATATMADIREAIKDSGSRVVGVMRQGAVVRLFKPRDGAPWTMYGQVDAPTDQSVAVFSLPKREWWWQIVEGPRPE